MTVFQISDDLFWGFNVDIDLYIFENNQMIIRYIKNKLLQYLLSVNLQLLVEKLITKNFHIHEDFQNLNKHEIVYICSNEH